MRVAVLGGLLIALGVALAAQEEDSAASGNELSAGAREQREYVFRPMFATRQRQRDRQRLRQRQDRLRRKHSRPKARALRYPVSGEPGMALKVSVNDLLFQSAPANDLPDLPDARGPGWRRGALRPMLLAKLRSGGRDQPRLTAERMQTEEEAEAFLLLSTDGGKPAIVPAPETLPKLLPMAGLKAKTKGNKNSKRSPYGVHKRVSRAAGASSLGQTLLDMMARGASSDSIAATIGERTHVAERVKQYDLQGAYPVHSYTHGRYTRAAPAPAPIEPIKVTDVRPVNLKIVDVKPKVTEMMPKVKDVKLKVKVHGDLDDDEDLETAQSWVFRPLFAHRERHADKLRRADKRRRLTLGLPAKKPTMLIKTVVKAGQRPTRKRGYTVVYPQRRFSYTRPTYYLSPYRRVVYFR